MIPPVCPNCLAPGTVPVRYQRAGMFVFESLLFPLSFFPFERRSLQTFHYCKACAVEARAETRQGRGSATPSAPSALSRSAMSADPLRPAAAASARLM